MLGLSLYVQDKITQLTTKPISGTFRRMHKQRRLYTGNTNQTWTQKTGPTGSQGQGDELPLEIAASVGRWLAGFVDTADCTDGKVHRDDVDMHVCRCIHLE